jgi:HK97 gp10 family phage protein
MVRKDWRIKEVVRAQEMRLDDALDLAAEIVVAEIKVRTPVDTGKLYSNNIWEESGHLKRRVFNNTEYAPFVEFGTVYMEAQPYMRPGYRAAIPKIKRMLKRI